MPDNTRLINWRDRVLQAWGDEYNAPETVYAFSGGRKFKSTDGSEHGVYRRGVIEDVPVVPDYEGISPYAYDYGGSSDWGSRGSSLDGAADSGQITVSFWARIDAGNGADRSV